MLGVEQVPIDVVRMPPHIPSLALQVEQHYAIAPMEAQAALLLAHIRQHCAEDSSYKVWPLCFASLWVSTNTGQCACNSG